MVINFTNICARAGFAPGADGKVNLPATNETAEALGKAALEIVLGGKPTWEPGDPVPEEVVLTGPGPVWGYLAIAHSLHGVVPALIYEAPNGRVKIYGHGQ